MNSLLRNKMQASYEHGKIDFLAGSPCDTAAVKKVYSELGPTQKSLVEMAWVDGWIDQMNESLMQSLPDGTPA